MTLHTELDHILLVTDPILVVFNSEGWPQGIIPYWLGGPSIIMQRDAQGVVRPFPGMLPAAQVQHMSQVEPPPNGHTFFKSMNAAVAHDQKKSKFFKKLRNSAFNITGRPEDAHCNKPSKDLDAHLESLGGDRIAPLGLDDDRSAWSW